MAYRTAQGRACLLCDCLSAVQERGIQDILAVEVSPAMVDAVHRNFPNTAASEGNTPQVRTWLGDVQSLPAYQVRFVLSPYIAAGHACFVSTVHTRDKMQYIVTQHFRPACC